MSGDTVDDWLGSKRTVHTAASPLSGIGLSMTILSRAISVESRPLYHDSDIICGSIHVNVAKKRSVTGISISLYGRHSCSGNGGTDNTVFLHLYHDVWSANSSNRPRNGGTYIRDLRGTNIWTFAIQLPANCNTTGLTTTPLPPSFGTFCLPEALSYEICCTVRRGLFSENQELVLPLRYYPRSVSGVAAASLLQAYRLCTPIPGPDVDADAWVTTRRILNGQFFSQRQVYIECEFSLAAPLQYTRGDPLPFAVKVSCNEQQLVDLFAVSPNFVSADLQRKIECHTDSLTDIEAIVGRGKSWVTAKNASSIRLAGEVALSPILQPSFQHMELGVQYFVQFRLQSPGLQLQPCSRLISLPVTICALRAPGPCPVSYASTVPSTAEEPVTSCGTHSLVLGVAVSAGAIL